MANTFYPKQSNATTAIFIPKLARFLINDLGGFTGPGWTIVDTYSQAAASPHEVPGTPTNMDSLAADNGWRTGTILANDYIILANNNGSFPFQVGIEFQSTTLIRFIIAPLSGFDTANNDADMIAIGNWDNPKETTFDFTTVNSPANYSIVADSDHFKLIFEQWTTCYWSYIGLPDTTTLHTGDANPALHYNAETTVQSTSGVIGLAYYRRISPVDNTTELTLNGDSFYLATSISALDSASLEYRLFPVYVYCPTVGHLGYTGKLKGVYVTAQSLGVASKGTLGSMAYAFVSNNGSYGPIVFEWDGVTAF